MSTGHIMVSKEPVNHALVYHKKVVNVEDIP